MRLSDCRVGQRVRMSETGRKVFRTQKNAGRILRVAKTQIVVQRDGVRYPDKWLPVYWELEGGWSDGVEQS